MKLEGPYFNTTGWEQDFNGLHPVNMLANIAKFQNKIEAKYEPFRGYVQKTGDGNFKKIVTCTYDNIIAHVNGGPGSFGQVGWFDQVPTETTIRFG